MFKIKVRLRWRQGEKMVSNNDGLEWREGEMHVWMMSKLLL